jgi:dCTP deaminase
MILSDLDLLEYFKQGTPVVEPFLTDKCRTLNGYAAMSYGLDSMGYDIRMSDKQFLVFQPQPGLILDPKNFDTSCLVPQKLHDSVGSGDAGKYFILPRQTYALCVSMEKFNIPNDTRVLFVGKSTYARCGVMANVTPGEAGWRGHLTIELTNTSPCDVKIYANEGILSCVFLRGSGCRAPYGDGKYQDQGAGVTVAKV